MRLVILSILVFIVFSCKENIKQQNHLLAGKVYHYGPELDSVNCRAYEECCCCGGNYYFINDSEYINEVVCVTDADYIAGKYKLDRDTLYLISDSISIYYQPDILVNNTSNQQQYVPDSIIRVEKIKPYIKKFRIYLCHQKKYFFNTEDKLFVTEDTLNHLNDALENLIETGIASKLNTTLNIKK